MGVMPCSVYGCSNVMCDRYSPEYGHICWEHFDQLVELGVDVNIDDFMNGEIKPKPLEVDPYDFFNEIFEDRYAEASEP